ncbi:MAG TPA: DUF4350 domain-containing protein [Stellaceae bacterium]|jgi:hypothetical protein|nr:DUF4350 domain-containing protein [Stellaceae bacterium]
MTGNEAFSPRILIGLVIGVACLFLLSLVLMTFGSRTEGNPLQTVSANSFSRSAIGQAGFAELLKKLRYPVQQSEYQSRAKAGHDGLLILAEPQIVGQSLDDLLHASNVLLILPKRTGLPDGSNPRWIDKNAVLPEAVAEAALRSAVAGGEIVRPDTASTWTTNGLGIAPDMPAQPQLMKSSRLTPLVANDAGMLIGSFAAADRHIWILSDPDIIANHAITHGDNAAFAIALIDALRKNGTAPIVFDETIHGFVEEPPSPFKLLFAFPYVLATGQALVAIGLLLWATLTRFGAPEPVAAPFVPGKYGLIENAAQLVERGRQQRILVRRYVEATLREVAGRLHAPRGLSDLALIEWLHRIEKARQVELDCEGIYRRALAAEIAMRDDHAALAPIARDVHHWKGAMLDGSE